MTITAAGIAVVVIAFFLFRGVAGRFGMILLVVVGSALGIAGDLRGVLIDIAGALTSVANNVGGAF